VIGRIALRRQRYELRATSERELRATSSERARGGDRDDRNTDDGSSRAAARGCSV
jgi:hypothetical protein